MSTKTNHKGSNTPNVLTPNKDTRKPNMSNKTTPANNASNQSNANKGTNGTNIAYDKAQGHRGTQLNPNQKK